MAVVRIQRLPVPFEMYQAVQNKIGVESDPPEGLIVHTVGETGGGLQVVDVWESEEAAQRFAEERLRPAIREVAGEQAAGDPPADSTTTYETKSLVAPQR